jgi:hypothetical protein
MKVTIQIRIEVAAARPVTVPLHIIDRACDQVPDVGLVFGDAKSILSKLPNKRLSKSSCGLQAGTGHQPGQPLPAAVAASMPPTAYPLNISVTIAPPCSAERTQGSPHRRWVSAVSTPTLPMPMPMPMSSANCATEPLLLYPAEPRPSYADQVLKMLQSRGLKVREESVMAARPVKASPGVAHAGDHEPPAQR